MMKIAPSALSNEALIVETRAIMVRSNSLSADLIAHLAEIDLRKLYLEQAHPSMFAWCVTELGCSEDVTCNLIAVARASRKWPAVLESLREGRVHLTGLRMLAPHLDHEGHRDLLHEASGKSKRQIEELLVRLAPKPPVPSSIRKLPARKDHPTPPQPTSPSQSQLLNQESTTRPAQATLQTASGQATSDSITERHRPMAEGPQPEPNAKPNGSTYDSPRRSKVEPLSQENYKVTFTASRSLRDKIQEAQDLLKHQNPDGDLSELVERGLDLLLAEVRKQRFGLKQKRKEATPKGRIAKAKKAPPKTPNEALKQPPQEARQQELEHQKSDNHAPPNPPSRHIPAEVRRAVVQRDGERCTYIDERGRRCSERGGLEFDHIEGFAKTGEHTVQGIRLMCRAHNQWAAEKMYGRQFIQAKRQSNKGHKHNHIGVYRT